MKNINKFLETNTASLKVPPQYMDAVSAKMTAIKDRKDALRLTALLELLDFLANIKDYKTGTSTAHSYVISETEGLRMNDIYQYTMAHYKEDIALETIARIAHLTPQAFCRYFKKHTRKTYITFLNDIRIAEACSKIINSKGASMSAVAYSTGFNNVVTFNRLFKKTMGCSPSEYLRVYDKKTH